MYAGQLLLPTTVSGPNRSPVESSTEHEVWKLMVWPLMLTLLSALNEPLTVNVWPLETEVADMPENEMDAVSGKLPVSAPYALDPWLLLLTPCPAVYKKVSDDGLFLLLLSQTRHF